MKLVTAGWTADDLLQVTSYDELLKLLSVNNTFNAPTAVRICRCLFRAHCLLPCFALTPAHQPRPPLPPPKNLLHPPPKVGCSSFLSFLRSSLLARPFSCHPFFAPQPARLPCPRLLPLLALALALALAPRYIINLSRLRSICASISS